MTKSETNQIVTNPLSCGRGAGGEARGLRNNNPLNIRRIGAATWRGLSRKQSDLLFWQFENLTMGYRAAAVLMRNYDLFYGINTVSTIISRWAPAVENNTLAYIRRVSQLTGFEPTHIIHAGSQASRHDLCLLLLAMASVECGLDLMHNPQHRTATAAAIDMMCYRK